MSIPSKMNALILKQGGFSGKIGTPSPDDLAPFLEYGKISVPKPRTGQVLIRVRLTSVNPSDMAYIQGNYGQPRIKGEAAGFEGVGVVVSSGGGIMAGWMKGKRVSFVLRRSGAWAEYVVADAAACIPLRKAVRDEDGAAMVVNPLTAAAMINIVKRHGKKAFVMSAAASQLGKLMTKLAAEEGLRPITIVRRENQVDTMKQMGAVEVLNSNSGNFAKDLADIIKSEKPEIFLDAVTGSHGSEIFKAMGMNARWIIYGRLDTGQTVIPEPGELIFLKKRIEGFWLADWFQKTGMLKKLGVIRKVQGLFVSGVWKTDIAATLSLADVHAKLPKLMQGENTGKIMLKPSGTD